MFVYLFIEGLWPSRPTTGKDSFFICLFIEGCQPHRVTSGLTDKDDDDDAQAHYGNGPLAQPQVRILYLFIEGSYRPRFVWCFPNSIFAREGAFHLRSSTVTFS